MKTGAHFWPDRRYRYWLTREWGQGPWCALIGLNPSTADETKDDHTITKVMQYLRSWGHSGLLMLNLYAFRSTDPSVMFAAQKKGVDIVGLQGNTYDDLQEYIVVKFPQVSRVVAAWGKGGGERGKVFGKLGLKMDCLMRNSDGSPAHPLYLPTGLLPEPWNYKP